MLDVAIALAQAAAAKIRLDGFANLLTGMGTTELDKTKSAFFYRSIQQDDYYWADLYEEEPFARRVCEKLPEEMLRAGFDLSLGSDGNTELAAKILDELKRLKAIDRIKSGLSWERVWGGCAVLIGADDGALLPAEPLREGTLRRISHLTVIDKPQVFAHTWYPATHEKAGQVELWSVQPFDGSSGVVDIHETRMLIFPGGRVTHQRRVECQGWGQSVLASVHDVLRDYSMSWAGIGHMLQSAQQDVWSLAGLRDALNGGMSKMREFFFARFQQAQLKMGPNRGLVLDASAGEKFQRFGATLTGIAETMQQMNLRICAACDMPATVLFGMSPAGLSATGESDLQIWDTTVRSRQQDKALPHLERLINLIMLQKEGPTRGSIVEGWGLTFRPLRELSRLQEAELRSQQAKVDDIYLTQQVLLPEEVATSRFRADGYSTETTIDLDTRQKLLEAEREARLEAEAEARAGGGDKDPPVPPGGDPTKGEDDDDEDLDEDLEGDDGE